MGVERRVRLDAAGWLLGHTKRRSRKSQRGGTSSACSNVTLFSLRQCRKAMELPHLILPPHPSIPSSPHSHGRRGPLARARPSLPRRPSRTSGIGILPHRHLPHRPGGMTGNGLPASEERAIPPQERNLILRSERAASRQFVLCEWWNPSKWGGWLILLAAHGGNRHSDDGFRSSQRFPDVTRYALIIKSLPDTESHRWRFCTGFYMGRVQVE
jgi:hypothetical protein